MRFFVFVALYEFNKTILKHLQYGGLQLVESCQRGIGLSSFTQNPQNSLNPALSSVPFLGFASLRVS